MTVSVARVFYTTRGRPRASAVGLLQRSPGWTSCQQVSGLQSVLHAAARLIYGVRRHDHVTPLLQQLHWLSVPERVILKLCVMVYRCLHGIGPEYFSEDFRLVSEIHSRQRWVRPPVSTLWFLPHVGLHLATAHFRSQKLQHGTRYRPVSTPHNSGDSLRHFCSSDNCVNNTNYCVVVLKCLHSALR